MVLKNKQLTDRAIYVYLPTVELADEWKSKADKASLSISKFVLEHVENSLKQEEEKKKSYISRAELLKQLKEKDEEIVKLKQDNRLLKMLADNLDKELKKYRAKPFVEDKGKFRGVREYDKELVDLLKKNATIDSDHLLKDLGISPKDTDLVKAVNSQLRYLQAYGLVEPTARGWRWTG
jgi:translation initiation factor 2B subunit (eIF-2B alpha/beta/delta family)